MTATRPAFYALRSGGLRDYVTLLHIPYTVWHLSYVAIGAAVAPVYDLGGMLWILLGFFLGMGVAAHALDELKDRPLRTRIPGVVLLLLATTSLTAAVAIGVWFAIETPALIPFVVLGPLLVVGYNLELWNLHNRAGFALAWGVFPVVVAYVQQGGDPWAPEAWAVAAGAGLLSDALRLLSLRARFLRRRVKLLTITTLDGEETVGKDWLMPPIEGALKRMSYAAPAVALGLTLTRL